MFRWGQRDSTLEYEPDCQILLSHVQGACPQQGLQVLRSLLQMASGFALTPAP